MRTLFAKECLLVLPEHCHLVPVVSVVQREVLSTQGMSLCLFSDYWFRKLMADVQRIHTSLCQCFWIRLHGVRTISTCCENHLFAQRLYLESSIEMQFEREPTQTCSEILGSGFTSTIWKRCIKVGSKTCTKEYGTRTRYCLPELMPGLKTMAQSYASNEWG